MPIGIINFLALNLNIMNGQIENDHEAILDWWKNYDLLNN